MANFKAVVRKKRADGFYPVYIRIVHRSRMGYIKTSKITTETIKNQEDMANFKAVVRKKRADGFYPVYIRIVHRSRMGYIKTSKIVTDKQLGKSGEIKDAVVNDFCAREILRYSDIMNRKDVSQYSVGELIEYLTNMDEDTSFSEFADAFIARMRAEGHERNAKNYRLAVDHLQRFLGTTEVMFSRLSTSTLNKWIDSLSLTNRAKEMYPTCVRQIFKKALVELNDEERGIIRIKYNPWLKINIPKSDKTMKLAISAEACREFFNRPLPKTKMLASTPELKPRCSPLLLNLEEILLCSSFAWVASILLTSII